MPIRYAFNENIVFISCVISGLFKTCDFENEGEVVAAQINEAIIFVAYADGDEGHAGNRGGARIENGGIDILIEIKVAVGARVHIGYVKTIMAPAARFNAIQLNGIIGIEVNVGAFYTIVGVHSIR
jgi:hypothetical protein